MKILIHTGVLFHELQYESFIQKYDYREGKLTQFIEITHVLI